MFRHAALVVCSLAIGNVASAQQPHYPSPYNDYSRYNAAPASNCPGGVCHTNPYASQTICGPDGCYRVTPLPQSNYRYDSRYAPNRHSTYRYPTRPASNWSNIFPFNLFRSRTPPPTYRPPVYAPPNYSPPVYSPPAYRPAPRPTYPGYPGSADVPADVGTLR